MLRRVVRSIWMPILLGLTGCHLLGRQGLPSDPLFANRKPVESKAKAGPPVPQPFWEPAPAPNPYFVDR